MALSKQETIDQSNAAFDLWGETWKKHAEMNGKIYRKDMHSHQDLLHNERGRKLLCIANGPSFEKNIEIIKKYKDNDFSIACVDKCFHHLVKHGIKPDYVFLADAGISYDKYLKPYLADTKDVLLISNITANPDWTHNWNGPVFFFVNKDNIKTEDIFIPISGCKEVIPASSNVGNTVIVFSVQILNPDELLLLGYDFCWGDNENYYAFEDSVKRYWMKHLTLLDCEGRLVNTSQNLFFSARWLNDFQRMTAQNGVKMFNVGECGVLNVPVRNLKNEIKDAKARDLSDEEKDEIMMRRTKSITIDAAGGIQQLNEVLNQVPVSNVIVNYIPKEVTEWLQPKLST